MSDRNSRPRGFLQSRAFQSLCAHERRAPAAVSSCFSSGRSGGCLSLPGSVCPLLPGSPAAPPDGSSPPPPRLCSLDPAVWLGSPASPSPLDKPLPAGSPGPVPVSLRHGGLERRGSGFAVSHRCSAGGGSPGRNGRTGPT
eukprot:superscaffoldBa00011924_g25439